MKFYAGMSKSFFAARMCFGRSSSVALAEEFVDFTHFVACIGKVELGALYLPSWVRGIRLGSVGIPNLNQNWARSAADAPYQILLRCPLSWRYAFVNEG